MTRSKPRRVLIVGSRWPPESFLERLFRGLVDEGLELWLALKSGSAPEETGIRTLRLPGRGTGGWWTGAWGELSARMHRQSSDVWPYLRRRWDVLYFPWNATAVSLMPLMQVGIPSIVSCRGSQILVAPHVPGREAMTDRFPEMFRSATAVHCVSEDIQRAAEEMGLEPSKARVIRPAVDPAVFGPAPRAEAAGPLRIAGIGSLIWRKGFEDALVALAHLRDRGVDFRYHLVGDGPDRQRLLFTAHDLKLQDRVVFHGAQTSEGALSILRESHAFLLSSVCEGISNAALEAMSCGLAVVSTRCGGMAEAIEHGRDGLLVPTHDPRAMADALESLAHEPKLRTRLAEAARRRVLSDFRLEDQIAAFRDLILEVAD